MKYITGIHALNLICSLDTSGDWHQSALQWVHPRIRETEGSLFGNYGIETNSKIPDNPGTSYVANHIRALLDLMEEGNFPTGQGMRDDFIGNPKYTNEIFSKVLMMRCLSNWEKINAFMGREYKMEWVNFMKEYGGLDNE